jgi:hypothetical protein
VLVFGNENRLKQAIHETPSSNVEAFNQIFARRFIHSAHLLEPATLALGLRKVLDNWQVVKTTHCDLTEYLEDFAFRVRPRLTTGDNLFGGFAALQLLKCLASHGETAKKLQTALIRRVTQRLGELRPEECGEFADLLANAGVKDERMWQRVLMKIQDDHELHMKITELLNVKLGLRVGDSRLADLQLTSSL